MKNLFGKLFILLSFFTSAQNGWNAYITYTNTSFQSGVETCLAIDKFNNKWIGFTNSSPNSPAAVAKYNVVGGYWTYYCKANTPIIPSNKVNTIACDTLGNVWIGTIAGLVKFDGVNFTAFTTSNSGIADDNILALECVGNVVYVGTQYGLSRFNGINFISYNTTNLLLGENNITAIKAESATKIWLGSDSKLQTLNFNSNYTSSTYTIYPMPSTMNAGRTNKIFIDNSGKKWLATSLKGVIEFDNTNYQLASTTYSDMIGAFLPSSCFDLTSGPNNGVMFTSSSCTYPTPSGNSSSCLLELLPNKKYKVYYVSNSNYSIGNYLSKDFNNNIFVSHAIYIPTAGLIRFMYSFNPTVYNSFGIGCGSGVTNENFRYLDINQVKAGIANRGDMFWEIGGNGYASYEVPKGSGTHSGFNTSLWIGGLDASNQLHIASQTYRQSGDDFWPGPLDTIHATCDSSNYIKYDKIWKVSYTEVNDFIVNFQLGNIANNTYTPSIDIITWPAKGTGNNSRNLAPYVDVNGNGIYDPLTGGDYPQIKGDQALFFIFNDAFAQHRETYGAPLGIEVHVMAYAYGCPSVLNGKNELAYTTFYNYKIYNRSNNNYHAVKIGLYDDVDLGNYSDDFLGCHVSSNLGFCYNGDGIDENYGGVKGYLNYPPAIGTCILKGPLAPLNDGKDNNNNGLIDETNEECLMNQFVFYTNNFGTMPASMTGPTTAYQYFNYINAQWRDSSNFTCGGNGYGGVVKTSFMFPWSFYNGMPCNLWADGTIPKGDRKHIISAGAFNLDAKGMVEFEFAKIWAVDSSSTGNTIGTVNKLISNTQKIISFYKDTKQSSCMPNMAIGINEYEIESQLISLFPNPATNKITLASANDFGKCKLEINDLTGRTIMNSEIESILYTVIDVSFLKPGIYFTTIRTHNGKSFVKKFIKE